MSLPTEAPNTFGEGLREAQLSGEGPTSYQVSILVGLNKLAKHVFGGSTSRHSKEAPRTKRRRQARVVRASRRANR